MNRRKANISPFYLDLMAHLARHGIKVEVQRGQCCHVAGDIAFDSQNNLWLVTGDDTPAGTQTLGVAVFNLDDGGAASLAC